ncbi:MAG: threonine aldolase [Verrucomicrobiota bacterium]|nr:threonine aldolase [Verrucomicrobiota bacterium]
MICPDTAHIWSDECGAPGANVGCTLLTVSCPDGKLTPELCEGRLQGRGFQHHVQPAAIFVSQSTELGTVYTMEELRRLREFAKREGLWFFMDGARVCNAAMSLGVSLKEMVEGVDVLSFGGTKNGLMAAEAVVFLREGLAEDFQYVRKQEMQLASKMRFFAAQFIALLKNGLWKLNAGHANEMAKLLERKVREQCPQLSILYPVESNAVFVQLPAKVLEQMQQKSFFWIWDEEKSVARWMTSWDTQPEFIERFVEILRKLIFS